MENAARSFLELERVHELLADWLQEHQEAVVRGQAAAACAAFARYERGLRAHMRAEEEILFPIYEQRVPRSSGGGLELFQAEHRKAGQLLERIGMALHGFEAQAELPAAARVALIELEAGLKHLLDHHHQREHTAFFPGLDAALEDGEREPLWEACDRLHRAAGMET